MNKPDIHYEVAPRVARSVCSWPPVEGGGRDPASRERSDFYNRMLRRIQRARMGRYPTPSGGDRHVFFDARGRKHVLELECLFEHVDGPGRNRVYRCQTWQLDEMILDPESGSLLRLTRRWRLPARPRQQELAPVQQALVTGLDGLDAEPLMRTEFRRSGSSLASVEVELTHRPPSAPGVAQIRVSPNRNHNVSSHPSESR